MELEIFWTQLAENKLQDIFHYYKHKANLKTARKIVFEIINETIDLDKNPEMGQIEEFLIERPQEFRYLISSNYKIIYYINMESERIIIANIFDTRQNPIKLNETR